MTFDFVKFLREFEDQLNHRAASHIVNKAVSFVRVDTGNLRNSITLDRVRNDLREVWTNEVYARVQEYGHPLYPNYGFTPYMRPAARDARQNIVEIAREAAKEALRRAQ